MSDNLGKALDVGKLLLLGVGGYFLYELVHGKSKNSTSSAPPMSTIEDGVTWSPSIDVTKGMPAIAAAFRRVHMDDQIGIPFDVPVQVFFSCASFSDQDESATVDVVATFTGGLTASASIQTKTFQVSLKPGQQQDLAADFTLLGIGNDVTFKLLVNGQLVDDGSALK